MKLINIIPIERELSNVIRKLENHCDTESNSQFSENNPQGNGFGEYVHDNIIPGQDRFQETIETFTSEFNMRLSQKMEAMMSMIHTQINRALTSAIAERVIPEIQNIVSFMSSSGNRARSFVCPQTVRKLEKTQLCLYQKLQKRSVVLQLIRETTETVVFTRIHVNFF